MRLSDLLGQEVVTEGGEHLGRVRDVRLVQDGPLLGTWGAAFRVDALIVGRGAVLARLGLTRDTPSEPDLLQRPFGPFRRRRPVPVPWDRVVEVGDVIRVTDDPTRRSPGG
ncbi:MAG TPA: PRC-barrel domain-containing protein [Acidimicrobiales bacterium]|nr:PRC-barrel domain-containing protein [Acidimicrobiales bacterium]